MKDSGVEWIGEIPETWSIERGKHILTFLERPIPPDAGVVTCFRDGEVTLRANRREEGFTVALKEIGYKGVLVGDLVVHGMDGFAGAIGISDSCGKCSPVLNILDSSQNKRFLMYYLRNMAYGEVFSGLATGIRQRSCDTGWNKLRTLDYVLPPTKEQQRIADFLDTRTSEIDASIAKTQESIEEYKKLKQAVITQAVTKGIRPGRAMKDSGVEWIGEIPEEWELRKLKYAVSVRNEKSHFSPSSGLYIGLENLGSMRSDIISSDSQYDEGDYASCEAEDVLYSKLRPYLCKCIITPMGACCTGEFLVIKSFVGLKEYLRYYLLGTEWTKNVTASTYGAKMPRANEAFILNQMCLMPSVEEQREIATYLDEKCAAIDMLIEKKQAIITELEAYKKSLIYEYVTGKKEVPMASC